MNGISLGIKALKLCLITHPLSSAWDQYCDLVLQSISGGVSAIQFRHKKADDVMGVHAMAMSLKSLLDPLHIPLIINDDVSLAKNIDAHGIHLGQSDVHPQEARALLGPNKIIGWSIETYEQLMYANTLNCIDYVAASAVFPSKTKTDCKTIWGLNGLKQLARHSQHPVIAIGGINSNNVREVMLHGAYGVAIISAIHDSHQPKHAAMELINIINQGESSV